MWNAKYKKPHGNTVRLALQAQGLPLSNNTLFRLHFQSEHLKSTFYDRFIEVKAIPQKPSFFWSRNELEIAKLQGEKYFLYLVDLSKIENAEYCPQIISNPVQSIMKSPDWIVEPESYHVQKI